MFTGVKPIRDTGFTRDVEKAQRSGPLTKCTQRKQMRTQKTLDREALLKYHRRYNEPIQGGACQPSLVDPQVFAEPCR